MTRPDLSARRHLHLVGIGGAGMSAIATVLVGMGHEVSGSDLKESSALERLRALGVHVFVGHEKDNLGDADVVATSSAVPETNVEVRAARERAIAVVRRAELLGAICALRRTIAVSGTHGKTTTSSMLALVLAEAGLAPSFVVGGDINEIGANAAWDDGEWLVVEADESDGTFLELPREIAVVTSVEPDHLDHYGTFAALKSAFEEFVDSAERAVVAADDASARALSPLDATTFGFGDDATYVITGFEGGRSSSRFAIASQGHDPIECALPVPGRHNARNAAAAAAAALAVGVDPASIGRALARFGGVARRFEFRGEANGAVVIDDYAHLPSEVAAAIDTARAGGFARVVCVFQPHRYSRIAAIGGDFADAFVGADILFVTAIYAAGETPRPGVSGEQVLDAVVAAHPESDARYVAERGELLDALSSTLARGDCCLVLGAGDTPELSSELIAASSAVRTP